jgi:hypothetical protein
MGDEAMLGMIDFKIVAHNLRVIVDVMRSGFVRSGELEGGEFATKEQKPFASGIHKKIADDCTDVINSGGIADTLRWNGHGVESAALTERCVRH